MTNKTTLHDSFKINADYIMQHPEAVQEYQRPDGTIWARFVSQITLVHGYHWVSGRPQPRCWLEFTGCYVGHGGMIRSLDMVMDLTDQEFCKEYTESYYYTYRDVGVTNQRRYSAEEVFQKFCETGHYGPWEE